MVQNTIALVLLGANQVRSEKPQGADKTGRTTWRRCCTWQREESAIFYNLLFLLGPHDGDKVLLHREVQNRPIRHYRCLFRVFDSIGFGCEEVFKRDFIA